jgi:hypothetical protein
VLDDFAPLRQINADTLSQEAALFAVGRRARAYDEIGYFSALGDNVASPNPPAGALLTYYLRDDLTDAGARIVLTVTDPAGKMVRQINGESKAGLHRTPWDLRETPPQNPQGQGRGGRQSADAQSGVADGGRGAGRGQAPPTGADAEPPNEEQPQPQAGRGGAGGGGGRGGFGGRGARGPLVKPGTYTVTLGKLVNGTVTPLAKPQTIEVTPLEPSNR